MVTIQSIEAREILDSRGNPTVEVDLQVSNSSVFRASVPSGASTGAYEAVELRDGDKNRYGGKGVLKAIRNIKEVIAPRLIGKDVTAQAELDKLMVEELDGVQNEFGFNKEKLGANAILPVSMAICRAGANAMKLPLYKYIANLADRTAEKMILPVPAMNVINGGSHAGNKLAIQEFMILPLLATSFSEAVRMNAEVYQILKSLIKKRYGIDASNVGDEGGFAPNIFNNYECLELLTEAINTAGYEGKIKIGCDVAASEFYLSEEKQYDLNFKTANNDKSDRKSADELIEMYEDFIEKFPLISIEDPFNEDDWEPCKKLVAVMGENIQIVGDDMLVTNPKRIQKAIDGSVCNALLLKVNQIGSITEAIDAFKMAKNAGWGVMVSHRSGETEDTFIADLTVGLGTGEIKTGAPCRGERTCKYNQLMRIEESLKDQCTYAGESFRNPDAK